jgi:hypothetical protein
MTSILRGYKTFHHQEKNKDYYVLNISKPFLDNKGVGEEFVSEFIGREVYSYFKPEFIGKAIDLIKEDKFTRGFYIEGKKIL